LTRDDTLVDPNFLKTPSYATYRGCYAVPESVYRDLPGSTADIKYMFDTAEQTDQNPALSYEEFEAQLKKFMGIQYHSI
jgi:hypothetical protein